LFKGRFASPWDEVAIALIQVITNRADRNFSEAYHEQAHLIKSGPILFEDPACAHPFRILEIAATFSDSSIPKPDGYSPPLTLFSRTFESSPIWFAVPDSVVHIDIDEFHPYYPPGGH
jgi:hypothetical protein